MTDPTPTLASIDGSIVLSLVSLTKGDDPRMDEASFRLVGPDLTAEATIDAYLIETLLGEVRALVAGRVSAATFGLGELVFHRGANSEIRVELGGGPYIGGAKRSWVCAFAAADHQVAGFCEALEETWRTKPAV